MYTTLEYVKSRATVGCKRCFILKQAEILTLYFHEDSVIFVS